MRVPGHGRGGAVGIVAAMAMAALAGCVEASGEYPSLTRFPEPPKVLSGAEQQQICETLLRDHEAGVALGADVPPWSTP